MEMMLEIYPAVVIEPGDALRYALSEFMVIRLLAHKNLLPKPLFVEYPNGEDFENFVTVTFPPHYELPFRAFVVLSPTMDFVERAYLYPLDSHIKDKTAVRIDLLDDTGAMRLYQVLDNSGVLSYFGFTKD